MTPDQFKQMMDVLSSIRIVLIGIYAVLLFTWMTRK